MQKDTTEFKLQTNVFSIQTPRHKYNILIKTNEKERKI